MSQHCLAPYHGGGTVRGGLTSRSEWGFAWAPLVIRLALGAIFIAHGAQKLFGVFGGQGIDGVAEMTTGMGFRPAILWAWMLSLTEFFGGLAVLVGLLTRLAALGIFTVMAVAVATVHGRQGFFLPGGFEFNLALMAMALSLVISGAGRISLDWYLRTWRDKGSLRAP